MNISLIEAHSEEVVVARWVLDTVVDHLNEHPGIVAEAQFEVICHFELLKAVVVDPWETIRKAALTGAYTGRSSHGYLRPRDSPHLG